jgi:uncharacterized protein
VRLPRPDPGTKGWLRAAGWLAATLGVAAAGGAGFAALGLPAAWLTGAMLATAAGALAGLPVGLPPGLRDLAFLLLGVSMGSTVTPETLDMMRAWPGSIALLVVSVVTTLAVSSFYLERVSGWDRVTARFASIPGALSSVLVLAALSPADLPRVVLAQTIRIFTLVALTPPLLVVFAGEGAETLAAAAGPAAPAIATAGGVLALLFAGAVAGAALERLGVPAGVLVGAMLASALLHVTGLVHGRPPPLLVIVATGVLIGARFRGTSLDTVRRTVPGAVSSVLLALAVSAAIAAVGARLLGLPFGQLWIAYAPGGVEAMAAMALALGLDPAFVGAHHILRILGLTAAVPVWLRRMRPPSG